MTKGYVNGLIKTDLPDFKEVKPAKKHYNKYINKSRAGWIGSIDEPISEISNGVAKRAQSSQTFQNHYPLELAIAYGLSRNLIELKKSDDTYQAVFFTKKGFSELDKIKKTTCAFTGRRVRHGEFS